MLNDLILIKMHKDIIKTRFQTNKKKHAFKFFKKDVFCVEFFSLQNIEIWRW